MVMDSPQPIHPQPFGSDGRGIGPILEGKTEFGDAVYDKPLTMNFYFSTMRSNPNFDLSSSGMGLMLFAGVAP